MLKNVEKKQWWWWWCWHNNVKLLHMQTRRRQEPFHLPVRDCCRFPAPQSKLSSPWEQKAPRGWCRPRRRWLRRRRQRRRPAVKTGSSSPGPWSGTTPAGATTSQNTGGAARKAPRRRLFLLPEGLRVKTTWKSHDWCVDAVHYWHPHKTERWGRKREALALPFVKAPCGETSAQAAFNVCSNNNR